MKDKKKVISLILSMLMLSSFGSSVYANNSDTILDEAENIAGEISVDTEITDDLITIDNSYPFDFEIVSIKGDEAVVTLKTKIKNSTFYLGVKGEKEEIPAHKSMQYIVEVGKEYSFVYTYSTNDELMVYNGTIVLVDYGLSGVCVKINDVALNTTYNGSIDVSVRSSDEYIVMSAGEKDEVESNDTYDLADRTYDDYDNYGTIDTLNDVDWWKVKFDEDGEANFWLGNIPEGCDYDLYVYDREGAEIDDNEIIKSQNSGNEQELITIEVEAGVTYYIKIFSYSGSSDDYYLFRTKNYPIEEYYAEDEYEPNDSIDSPKYMDENGTYFATIHDLNDEDYYRIYLNDNYDMYDLTVRLRDIPAGCDYELMIYDHTTYEPIYRSTNNDNSSEFISETVEPGMYYIWVYSHRGYSNAEYRLSISSDGMKDYNNFRTDYDDVSIPEGSFEDINAAELLYGSMPYDEYEQRKDELSSAHETAVISAAAASLSLPESSDMLNYFLLQRRNSEGSYREFPAIEMLIDNGRKYTQYNRLIDEINDIVDAAEYFMEENNSSYVEFGQIEQNTSSIEPEGNDWHLSVNKYRTWASCSASRSGNNYEATIKYYIEDYYDYAPYNGTVLGIATNLLNDLHYAGMARNYNVICDPVTINIEWVDGYKFTSNDYIELN